MHAAARERSEDSSVESFLLTPSHVSWVQLRLPGLHGTILPTSNLSGCLPGVLIALFGFVYLERNVVALFHFLVVL